MSQLRLGDDGDLRRDAEAAALAAAEGMSKADRALRVQIWKVHATAWFDTLPAGEEFTADDLTAAVGLPDHGTNRNNVIGAWFSGKSRKGEIVWTGRWRKSERVIRHAPQNRVWRKL